MNIIKHDPLLKRFSHERILIFLIIIAMLMGCSDNKDSKPTESNESKIIGAWERPKGASVPVYYRFYKGGAVERTITYAGTVKNTKYSIPSNNVGKYKFEDDKNISITWGDNWMEIIDFEFADRDKLFIKNKSIELNRIYPEK